MLILCPGSNDVTKAMQLLLSNLTVVVLTSPGPRPTTEFLVLEWKDDVPPPKGARL